MNASDVGGTMGAPDWMMEATTPFSSVLVANRGEIAVRVLRAVRECGLRGVAVYNDLDSDSMHLNFADEKIRLPGEDLASTYLSMDAILDAAMASGADAIHPGYGFLSERSEFADRVIESGLVWIGPSADAIRTMGDKIRAREAMVDALVPVIPGKSIEVSGDEDPLPQLAAAAAEVGYPLLPQGKCRGRRQGHAYGRGTQAPQDRV